MKNNHIEHLGKVNPNYKGFSIITGTSNGLIYEILRVEISVSTGFSMDEFHKFNSEGLPYIPNTEKSVFIKTPRCGIFISDKVAQKFKAEGSVTIVKRDTTDGEIYNPYLSWHGGMEATESKGTISLRGAPIYKKEGVRKRKDSRQEENVVSSVSKDSFAANYNPIANVIVPRSFASLPVYDNQTLSVETIRAERFTPETPIINEINYGLEDIYIDRNLLSGSGLSIVFAVHNQMPVNINKFSEYETRKWLLAPITFSPNDNVPLACTAFFHKVNSEVVIDGGPLIFIGISTEPNQNIAFSAFNAN